MKSHKLFGIDNFSLSRYKLDMFGMSGEHLLILGIVLLIFGPRRLPELGNTMGKAIRNFKDALSGVEEARFRKIEDEKVGTHKLEATKFEAHTVANKEAPKRESPTEKLNEAAFNMAANGDAPQAHNLPPSSPA